MEEPFIYSFLLFNYLQVEFIPCATEFEIVSFAFEFVALPFEFTTFAQELTTASHCKMDHFRHIMLRRYKVRN